MSSQAPVLLDISSEAYTHQGTINEVKRVMGIDHPYFDCWIYGFAENKKFDVKETVAKLQRREEFEKEELAPSEVTEWMMDNMKKGIIQVIGNDKEGRVTFYICTARDKPTKERREESRRNFDMFVSYGTRLRPESKRCQMAMIINQDKASMRTNLDMGFQADIAMRIAKYYPGCIDKMYICKMNRLLAALAKPIFSRLPSIVSDRIIIMSEGDIKGGKLLDLYDADVLPTALGGNNDCDKEENYEKFAHTIKDYFEDLRRAVKSGMTVKEWELSNLKADENTSSVGSMDALKRSVMGRSPRASLYIPPGSAGVPMDMRNTTFSTTSPQDGWGDDEPLFTCDTITEGVFPPRAGSRRGSLLEKSNRSRLQALQQTPRDLFADYMEQFEALESFFRLSIGDAYEREWFDILQRATGERDAIVEELTMFRGDMLFQAFSPSMQLMFKGFMWLCMMLTSFYFFLATLFLAIVGVLTLVYIFFAMFTEAYYVFLYGTAFIITAAQFTLCCSRGYDIMISTFNGRLVEALRAFGAKTLLFQAFIYISTTIANFVVFCVMAQRHDPLTGLLFSIAYGWIVAVCLTFIYHVVYAFGFKKINLASSGKENAEATLYFFMDVDLDDGNAPVRATAVITMTMLILCSFAFGIAYMVGGGIFFVGATVVTTGALLFMGTAFLAARGGDMTTSLSLTVMMFASVFWLSAVFTMATYGWRDEWGASLLASLFVFLFICILTFATVYAPWKSMRRWLFRISWLLVVADIIACVVALIVENYRMGLFILALALHLLVCLIRTTGPGNIQGAATMSIGFVLVLLACCLMGNYGTKEAYAASVSHRLMPNYATAVGEHSPGLAPVCQAGFPTKEMDILGLALFAKVGYCSNADARQKDLERWFPGYKVVEEFILSEWNVMSATAFKKVGDEVNITIVAVQNGPNVHVAIEAMTMWIDQYVISFFSFLMPSQYLVDIMPYISFASDFSPSMWRESVSATGDVLAEYLDNITNPNEHVYVVGHGSSGAAAAVVGLQTKRVVHTIIFSSPQVIPSKYSLHTTDELLAKNIIAVQTTRSIFNTWMLRSPHTQVIPCEDGGHTCDHLDSTIVELASLCNMHAAR